MTIDRMKDRHNGIAKQLAKVSARRDKIITSLVRVEAQRVSLIRTVARSQKRLDKARSLAALNAPLPDAKPEPLDLGSMTADESKPHPLDIPPELRREPKPPIYVETRYADHDKAEPKPKRRKRRTPEDFRNDMAAKR
jgi:hypothetical protein